MDKWIQLEQKCQHNDQIIVVTLDQYGFYSISIDFEDEIQTSQTS